MEDNPVVFMRLLSDESTQSTLSSDSCEYYQTEIFDQLPSIQASRPEQSTQGLCDVHQGGPEPGESISHGHLSRGAKDKESTQPLKNMVMCIQGKRTARERRKMQINNIGFWESWRRSQSITRKRVWVQMGGALSSLLPWRHTLHAIEGKFGVGVKAYFVFLRYLVFLNLLNCALTSGFILGPTAFYGRRNGSEHLFGGNDSVLDFFLGTGYLDRSPVFIGFYTRGSLDLPCLNTPLLYLAGILTMILLSLIMVVRRTIVGYKHTWMLGKRYSANMSYKIFCGWDFTIQDPASATLKHSFIRNDLKLFLEEQNFSMREAQRTLGQRVRLYLLRFILNLIVLSLLGGAFSLIYFATKTSQSKCMENRFGREMYKLCIFNFLATFCNAFLLNYPRKLVQEKFPTSLLARVLGKQRFLIPFNVLDLVYSQTVSWVGVYYCPLLPLIGTVTLIATFYIQKFVVMRCCVAEQRMFRASSSSVLFHFMLLLGLLMAAVTLGFSFHLQNIEPDITMSSCGPFQNGKTVFIVTKVCVESLPSPAPATLSYLSSEAFALPLILAEIIILTSYVSRGRANQKAIERLKDMLVMSSSDKRFLVKQHATMLRCRNKNRTKVHSAAVVEDNWQDPPSTH
ncbi:Transmembrane channel-like protein 7 [Larimichthys crocea]|uniref:Uncharacterized protein n=1 Tax=Larimichthys crocea TaxID=215358 RepID=A0ACD3RYE0_LARCR|nr:Transmembrane channel-like protein 7 [Larimichthys crocea]